MLVQKEAPAVPSKTVCSAGFAARPWPRVPRGAAWMKRSMRWSCISNRLGFTSSPTQRQGIFKKVTQRLGGNYRKTLIRFEQAELLISFKKPV